MPFQECQYDEFPRGVSLVSSYHGGSRDRDSLRRLTLTRAHPHAIPVHGFQGASRVELDTVVPDVRLTSTFGTPLAKLCNRFALANDPEIRVADSSPRTELSTIAQFCLGLQSHLPLLREEQNVPHNISKRIFLTTMKMPITSSLFPFFEYSRVYILSKASRVCLNLIGLRCQWERERER